MYILAISITLTYYYKQTFLNKMELFWIIKNARIKTEIRSDNGD